MKPRIPTLAFPGCAFLAPTEGSQNLTDYEKKTGWKYSITCTNIPDAGISGMAGSHHPQYAGVVHREHAVGTATPWHSWRAGACRAFTGRENHHAPGDEGPRPPQGPSPRHRGAAGRLAVGGPRHATWLSSLVRRTA